MSAAAATERPVLSAIRDLLKFKDYTTIPEIASTTGLKRLRVLAVINANGPYVWRKRNNGHITRVDPQTRLREQLWQSGRFYRSGTYGMWAVEGNCLEFSGNQALREQLQEARTVGALGDSSSTNVVIDTPQNRAALEAAGLRPWAEAVVDDSLWVEQ